ncbi:NAD(P)-binding protein [Acephala macrosclerotiorum]|nr:NAD(P)-binding protein [Acephala macrosclerotiorum]
MMAFNLDTDIPDLSGQVILVTGGTSGLGTQTVLLLAAHNPAHIYFIGRSASRANEVISKAKSKHPSVPITFLEFDLASLASVQLTKDGYENQFGTNHMGHALLVKLLLPMMIETAKQPATDVRIVFLSSDGAGAHPPGANILFAAELARGYKDSGILFLSINPGVYKTEMGAWNTCWAATVKTTPQGKDIVNGEYYNPVGVPGKKTRDMGNDKLAAELWEWTGKELENWT